MRRVHGNDCFRGIFGEGEKKGVRKGGGQTGLFSYIPSPKPWPWFGWKRGGGKRDAKAAQGHVLPLKTRWVAQGEGRWVQATSPRCRGARFGIERPPGVPANFKERGAGEERKSKKSPSSMAAKLEQRKSSILRMDFGSQPSPQHPRMGRGRAVGKGEVGAEETGLTCVKKSVGTKGKAVRPDYSLLNLGLSRLCPQSQGGKRRTASTFFAEKRNAESGNLAKFPLGRSRNGKRD